MILSDTGTSRRAAPRSATTSVEPSATSERETRSPESRSGVWLRPNGLSGGAVMTVIEEFSLNEFDHYVAGVLGRKLAARRRAEHTFNIFNVVLDPDAGLATVQDELDPDRSEVVALTEFARMVEERSQE